MNPTQPAALHRFAIRFVTCLVAASCGDNGRGADPQANRLDSATREARAPLPGPIADAAASAPANPADAATSDGGDASSPAPMTVAGGNANTDAATPRADAAVRDPDASTRDAGFDASVPRMSLESGVPRDAGREPVLGDADAIDAATGIIGTQAEGGTERDGTLVFATSIRYSAGLGGLSGADSLCMDHAAAGGHAGQFRAWLSTMNLPVTTRLVPSNGPYIRTDGVEIAANWDDLLDATLTAPLNLDETGLMVGGDVWTGTLATGQAYLAADCDGFTNGASGAAQCGASTATSGAWTENIVPACSNLLRLYCFEQ